MNILTVRGNMQYILEITTKIGCSNMCEYCPQTKLIKNFVGNVHNERLVNYYESSGDTKSLDKLLTNEYVKDDKNRVTMMSMKTFEKCLSTVSKEVDIHFTGYTEAFENPNCTDMIEHAHKKGHKVLINTTLVGMKKNDIDRLEKIPSFKEFNVHLTSATYFENIGKNSPSVKSKTGREISDDYLEMIDYIIDADFRKVFHTHSAEGYKLHPEIEKHAGDRIRAIGYKNRGLNSRAGNLGKLTGKKLWENNWCHRIIHNVLLPDGTLQLCCQDYGLEEPLGNLLQMDYPDIFETKNFKTRIMTGKTDICNRCDDGVAVPNEGKVKLRSMQKYESEWRIKS